VIALILAAGCAFLTPGRESEVARTWEHGRVYLPRTSSYSRPSDVSARDPLPTVLFLHGCTGITAGAERWAETLTTAGYAVVMPDSFARYYRPSNCDPKTYSTGLFPEARRMRQEEIDHALRMLRASPWADQGNVFLMGHSEGGAAVVQWRGNGFKALIVSGNRCRRGIQASLKILVMAINFEHDPWTRGRDSVTCASRFGGRENAVEVLLPGRGHDTSRSLEARSAVLNFLHAQTNR
jgi:dienelactone hydrolase